MRALPSLLYIITSQRPHLLIPSHWALALQHVNLGLGWGTQIQTIGVAKWMIMERNLPTYLSLHSVKSTTASGQNYKATFLLGFESPSICSGLPWWFRWWHLGSIPGSKREGRRWPTLVLLPGEFHRRRSLAGYSPWGYKESARMEWLTLSFCLGRTSLGWLAKKGGLLTLSSSQNELLPLWASSFWVGGRQCFIHFLPILRENERDGNYVRVNFIGRAQDKKHILNRRLKP